MLVFLIFIGFLFLITCAVKLPSSASNIEVSLVVPNLYSESLLGHQSFKCPVPDH